MEISPNKKPYNFSRDKRARTHFTNPSFLLLLSVEVHIVITYQAESGSEQVAEQQQAAGAEGFSGHNQGNWQEPPRETDIWDVVLSFRNSLHMFFQYLADQLKVTVRHFGQGSLLIIVECSLLQILEDLWEDYQSGHLNQVAQETLISAEVLEKLGRTEVKLKTFISEKDYLEGKQILIAISGKSTILRKQQ